MRSMSFTAAGGQRPTQPFMMALAARILRALERRRAIHELARLDDHMLSDIGVSRSDISRVVEGHRY